MEVLPYRDLTTFDVVVHVSFRIASTTKSLTAALTLALISEGRLAVGERSLSPRLSARHPTDSLPFIRLGRRTRFVILGATKTGFDRDRARSEDVGLASLTPGPPGNTQRRDYGVLLITTQSVHSRAS